MKVVEDISELKEYRKRLEVEGLAVGFVPTMGNLHRGHTSMLERSVVENEITLLSIFVNPTQFNEVSDLEKYPRTMEKDMELARSLGVDYVFCPGYDDLYPDGYKYKVSEVELSKAMEGNSRPGHFDGMLTVVLKLLMLVRPKRAYFGEKDYQQLALVRGMVEAFFLDVEIVPHATVRDEDGLALSSRNSRLTPEQRAFARVFPELLRQDLSCEAIQKELTKAGFDVDYIEEAWGRRFGALRIGDVRLIDNFSLKREIKLQKEMV